MENISAPQYNTFCQIILGEGYSVTTVHCVRSGSAPSHVSSCLTFKTFEIGTASGLDVATAQTCVDTAHTDITIYRTQVEQDLNTLTLLLGQSIDPTLVADIGKNVIDPLAPLIHAIGPAADAPSELLQRRPDVLACNLAKGLSLILP